MKSLDSNISLSQHQQIVENKIFLKKIYEDFYQQLGVGSMKGKVVELGAGIGFIKTLYPRVVTSDVIKGSKIDVVFSAQKMPFKSKSLAGIVMVDTLHHIKDPEKALKEMERCLKIGGKIVMVEPYNSFWGRFIYQNFHHEDFNPKSGWQIKGKGRLSDANGAMPWIIFKRDKKIFEQKFPKLKIIKVKPHTPFRYLLSGGLSKPQLVPNFLYDIILAIEKFLTPFNNWIGMFVTIELKNEAA